MCASGSNDDTTMVNDVGRAYFSASAIKQVFAELLDEDKVDG